jgi:hypothetical protein
MHHGMWNISLLCPVQMLVRQNICLLEDLFQT